MTNNAQLLPLPEDRLSEIIRHVRGQGLSNQSAKDVLSRAMAEYALACVEAAKTADALRSLPVVAEGLAEALADVMTWISNWTPDFIYDPEWPDSRERAVLALATYEAAQGEKK